MTTPRLGVSLIGDDEKILIELRNFLERRLERRLTLAEVVRMAIHKTHADEKSIAAQY